MSTKTVIGSALVVGMGALFALSSSVIAGAAAQNSARLSPHEHVDASIDGAELSIAYGRPSMRGRTVMGRLVPYGRVWCPGADEATTITTSKALRLGDLSLDAGSYTLWMLPTASDWTLIVNKQTGIFHTEYSSRSDVGRVKLQHGATEMPVEQLTFAIEKNPAGAGGLITMSWETTAVAVPFTVVQ